MKFQDHHESKILFGEGGGGANVLCKYTVIINPCFLKDKSQTGTMSGVACLLVNV